MPQKTLLSVTIATLLLTLLGCAPLPRDGARAARLDPPPAVMLSVDRDRDYVNVMDDRNRPLPGFPALTRKPGFVRGYVEDTQGRPLQGAAVGLKTANLGVDYLTASAVTDADGYYEIKIPLGGAKFHYAGYAVAYGAGRAALGLHPAGDRLEESYAAAEGGVQNFVLLPYGVASRDGLRENPKYRGNFYGGTFSLVYRIAPPGQDAGDFPGMVPAGAEIVIRLTPLGELVDGSAGGSFVIRKAVEDSSIGEFFINNAPVGRYRLEVSTADGKSLRLRQKTPTGSAFGIHPSEAEGSVTLTFNPESDDPKTAMAAAGNWSDLQILLEQP